MCVGVRLEKSGRRGEGALSKKRKSHVWGSMGGSQSAGGEVGGSKQPVVRFGASVNDPPKAGNSYHLYSIPSICPNTVFFPPIQVEKSGTSIHLKFQSALAVEESDLLCPSTAAL
ncbi:hypothetical protein AVEN_78647-1 [Araneus ventricosus]|uniref:Uncharacterized protein n=1 Tax=Araneus ventricosus TaxID=182803 RepID=A0A4Y2IAR1_ARAVE|nr:hypothetical protein AVEN_78647-1 [Araneus ventricosus]